MKFFKYLALLAATTMFLAACQQSEDEGGTSATTGTITVTVVGADGVDVSISGQGESQSASVTGSYTFEDLAPGEYDVTASKDGYGPSPYTQPATVVAGEDESVPFTLERLDDIGGQVANIAITAVTDDAGAALPTVDDPSTAEDPNKTLIALAQQEDDVCVSIEVTDADGNPVENAPVNLTAVVQGDDYGSDVSLSTGPCNNGVSTQAMVGTTTDSDGVAHFQVEALFAPSEIELQDEPVKIEINATGSDNTNVELEFKTWYLNMSHLWLQQRVPSNSDEAWANSATDLVVDTDASGDPVFFQQTDTRTGHDFGVVNNVWDYDNGAENGHYFATLVRGVQPMGSPTRAGQGIDGTDAGATVSGYFEVGFDSDDAIVVSDTGTAVTATNAQGFVVYELSGDDVSSVEFIDGTYHAASSDGLTVIDDTVNDGNAGVGIKPVTGVSLEDLPLSVDVKATYHAVIGYDTVADGGDVLHVFPLKDYTFTKTWGGGFLTVDKEVDQHVLTWKGADITLAASEDTTSADFGEDYTSTAYITVTNDSQASMTDVSINDVLPAELGVIEDSISDGGTYNAANHAVTWLNLEEAETLAPGESTTVSFDVYARHKPGYCWNGDNSDAGYGNISPITGDLDGSCEAAEAYADPYQVTNGAQFDDGSGNALNPVTASAFTAADGGGSQEVFAYIPEADESDVWVVRPLFSLTKEAKSNVIETFNVVEYDIEVEQIDRTANEYAALEVLYPWEFNDGDTDGTGHKMADASTTRNNPYASSVDITDRFETRLDFNGGTDFDGSLITTANVEDEVVEFSTIDDLPFGETQTATLKLKAQLPSDDAAVGGSNQNAQNLAHHTITGTDSDLDGEHAWMNCAYLEAGQLNQPIPSTGSSWTDTWYGSNAASTTSASTLWFGGDEAWRGTNPSATDTIVTGTDQQWQWHQVGAARAGTQLLTLSGSDVVSAVDANATGKLEYCDPVVVHPPQGAPLMTFTTQGEFTSVSTADFTYDPATSDDGFDVGDGDQFWYVLTAKNSGSVDADGIVITLNLDGNEVEFTGESDVYVADGGTAGDPDGGTEGNGSTVVSSFASGSVTLETINGLAQDEIIRILIKAEAANTTADNQIDLVGELTYTNAPAGQTLPIDTDEPTTVQP